MNAAVPAAPNHREAQREARRGFGYGVAAYSLWGVLPIYFKAIADISAFDIVAHRVLWSLPFLALLLLITRGWSEVQQAFRRRRTLLLLLATPRPDRVNWLLYVYAVTTGTSFAASLGYYLNPLATCCSAVSSSSGSRAAVERDRDCGCRHPCAGRRVARPIVDQPDLVRQLRDLWVVAQDRSGGLPRRLAIETALLFPLAVAWLAWAVVMGSELRIERPPDGAAGPGRGGFDHAAAAVHGAARRLRYSTLGMLQFLAPTLQFLCAVWLYGSISGAPTRLPLGPLDRAGALRDRPCRAARASEPAK